MTKFFERRQKITPIVTLFIGFVLNSLALFEQTHAQTSVETYHNDSLRTGWNQTETALTVASVSAGPFVLQHSVALDAQVDAQPLFSSNQSLSGQTAPHDVVYVATEANTIYAIDASTGAVLLSKNFGQPVPSASLPGKCDNNGPTVGINSTPVISQLDNTMWVVTYNNEFVLTGTSQHFGIDWHPEFKLHALDLRTLEDKLPPAIVAASAPLNDGSVYSFNPAVSRQRSALLHANNSIYVAFASFCDQRADLSRGWLLRWNDRTLSPYATNELTDRDSPLQRSFHLTSIWMSGFGPSTELPSIQVNKEFGWKLLTPVYFSTGNSDFLRPTSDRKTTLAESVVKIASDLSVVHDYFTPFNAVSLDHDDQDFGSGGVMLLPDARPPTPHLGVAAGKQGTMFLLNRDHLGKYLPNRAGASGLLQPGSNDVLGSYQIGGCFCGPSYFTGADGTGRVVSSGGNSLIVWKVNDDGNATLAEESKSPSLQTGQDSGFFTSVSSNGTQAGSAIIWAVSRPIERKTSNVLLYAIDASNAKIIISSVAGTWPEVDANANIVPTIANGRVYVASYKELAIFGIGNPISPPILAQLNEFRTQSIADVNQWPNLQSGEHAIYGTVRDINGSTLIVEKRDRTMVNVDIGEANLRHNVAAPEIGHGALIRGRYDDGGTLVATAVLHAKSQPALWRDDH